MTPYPVSNLYLKVVAQTVKSLDINPLRAGMFQTGHAGNRDGWVFSNIQNASGDYQVSVHSEKPETFEV